MNFSELTDTAIAISIIDMLVSLVLSSILGFAGVLLYRYTHRGLNYDPSFSTSLLLITPIIALIMMFIQSNLALSLGMVGALSIIRFRTVIKDSRDMIFLFLMISVGLGCGTYNWKAIIPAFAFISLITCILHWFRFGSSQPSSLILVVNGKNEEAISSVREYIKGISPEVKLRTMDIKNDQWEFVVEIPSQTKAFSKQLSHLSHLKTIPGVVGASLLAPQTNLPL